MAKKLLLIVLFIGLALTAVTDAQQAYHNREYGFSIAPPIGWGVEERMDQKVPAIIFWGPTNGVYETRIIISINEGTPDVPLVAVASAVKEAGMDVYPVYQALSERGRMINGLETYELVSARTIATEEEDIEIKAKEVLLMHDGKIYTIEFIASLEDYDKYLPLFEESIQTFEFEGRLQRILGRFLP